MVSNILDAIFADARETMTDKDMAARSDKPFWEVKTLAEMTQQEWESVCDGCGKCCLHKLQDEYDDAVYYTSVVCLIVRLASARITPTGRNMFLIACSFQRKMSTHWGGCHQLVRIGCCPKAKAFLTGIRW